MATRRVMPPGKVSLDNIVPLGLVRRGVATRDSAARRSRALFCRRARCRDVVSGIVAPLCRVKRHQVLPPGCMGSHKVMPLRDVTFCSTARQLAAALCFTLPCRIVPLRRVLSSPITSGRSVVSCATRCNRMSSCRSVELHAGLLSRLVVSGPTGTRRCVSPCRMPSCRPVGFSLNLFRRRVRCYAIRLCRCMKWSAVGSSFAAPFYHDAFCNAALLDDVARC